MNNFIQNLVSRHRAAVPVVQPRPQGRFEPLSGHKNDFLNHFGEPQAGPQAAEGLPEVPTRIAAESTQTMTGSSATGGKETADFTKRPQPDVRSTSVDKISTPQPGVAPEVPISPKEAIAFQSPVPPADSGKAFSERRIETPPDDRLKATKQDKGAVRPLLPEVKYPTQTAAHLLVDPSPLPTDFFENKKNNLPVISRQSQPPTIKVSIGRIEVKAQSTPPAAPPPVRKKAASGPTLSLEEYLKKQNNRSR